MLAWKSWRSTLGDAGAWANVVRKSPVSPSGTSEWGHVRSPGRLGSARSRAVDASRAIRSARIEGELDAVGVVLPAVGRQVVPVGLEAVAGTVGHESLPVDELDVVEP